MQQRTYSTQSNRIKTHLAPVFEGTDEISFMSIVILVAGTTFYKQSSSASKCVGYSSGELYRLLRSDGRGVWCILNVPDARSLYRNRCS